MKTGVPAAKPPGRVPRECAGERARHPARLVAKKHYWTGPVPTNCKSKTKRRQKPLKYNVKTGKNQARKAMTWQSQCKYKAKKKQEPSKDEANPKPRRGNGEAKTRQ